MNLQRTIKAMAAFTCWALVSTEALAAYQSYGDANRYAPRLNRSSQGTIAARLPVDQRAVSCLAAMAAGEANGYGDKALTNTMKTVMNRFRLGYGSSVCGLVYARRQFAPRASRVTPHIRQLAAKVYAEGLTGLASAPTHFHSYRNRFDRRASSFNKYTYLGFDGAHHLFVNRSIINARLASANIRKLGSGQGTEFNSPQIMAATDRNRSGLWTSTAI